MAPYTLGVPGESKIKYLLFAGVMSAEKEKALREKAKEQLQTFLAECKVRDFRGKRILEIGFKNGVFLDECVKAGLAPVGLEVVKSFCDDVKNKLPHLELILYDGGRFPVPDESFDFVVSFQVLEHVKSTEHIFNECIRVLRPGGIMYHVIPNYHSFYEGHYSVLWFPFLNKFLGRLYLKLLRKYNNYYESLNLVKPRTIRRDLKIHENRLKVLSLGREEFISKFNPHQINKVNQKFLRGILKCFLALPLLKNTLLYLVTRANIYYPITVIAQKL
jgi:SAM-dependent methyltransferase